MHNRNHKIVVQSKNKIFRERWIFILPYKHLRWIFKVLLCSWEWINIGNLEQQNYMIVLFFKRKMTFSNPSTLWWYDVFYIVHLCWRKIFFFILHSHDYGHLYRPLYTCPNSTSVEKLKYRAHFNETYIQFFDYIRSLVRLHSIQQASCVCESEGKRQGREKEKLKAS